VQQTAPYRQRDAGQHQQQKNAVDQWNNTLSPNSD